MKKEIKKLLLKYFLKVKESFITTTKGEANFNFMLYGYGVIPALFYILFFKKKISYIGFVLLRNILFLIISLYFLWHLYVIWKTLKVHPEYKKKKITKKDLIVGKTKEEIKEIEKQIGKDRLKKAFLLKAWDTTPNYVIVVCIDIYISLTLFQLVF